MTTSELIQPGHLKRKAVIYIRQSTPNQVTSHRESQKMQRAMKDRALQLGWPEHLIEVVERDTGLSAQNTEGRDGYKALLSELALGLVGVVLSYESTRLSRNCSDWYVLLDLCAYNRCLIADRDGIYDPANPNGRILLGMKGMLSEFELHTLRGRLIAGAQNKAARGELALRLPAGLCRRHDGTVVKDPDLRVQETISLVFDSFLRLKSAYKVLTHLRNGALMIPRRQGHEETVWREPTLSAILRILKNPAYAGAFAYGRTQCFHAPGGKYSRKHRKRSEWTLVKDRYPAFVPWEAYERIQSIIEDNYAEYRRRRSRGVTRKGRALLQGLVYCAECGHKMSVQYTQGARYVCEELRASRGEATCQFLPAAPLDDYVAGAFFEALSPSELDIFSKAMEEQGELDKKVDAARERELQRLRYEADLARRQYDKVDPDNRLVASELERRWEEALRGLRAAELRFEQDRQERDKTVPIQVPPDVRQAFESVSRSLPIQWESGAFTHEQKKALLRCLIDKVALRRTQSGGQVHTRIVWRGGAVSEDDVFVPVRSLSQLSNSEEMETLVLELNAQDNSNKEIAQILTERGFRSPKHDTVLLSTVRRILRRHGRPSRRRGAQPRRVAGFLTVSQLAEHLGVKKARIHYLIRRRVIQVERDAETGLYLFPERPEQLRQLRERLIGPLQRQTEREEHQDA